jgi:hypothetical protein
VVLFVGIFLSACGYHFEGGGELPAGVRNVFVGVFENRTSETGLENIFTNDLINEFTRSKRFAGREKAEAVLSGVIFLTEHRHILPLKDGSRFRLI